MTMSDQSAKMPSHAAHSAGTLSPNEQAALWALEELFWTSGAEHAQATTATNAVMVFPYPPGILQGDQIWHHLQDRTGWRSVLMSERRVMCCGAIAILTYRVSAEKTDVEVYKALCSSTYLQDDDSWLRISHQQTLLT